MRRTLQFHSRIVPPFDEQHGVIAPIKTKLVVDTSKATSLVMTFSPCEEHEVTWHSNISLLSDSFAGKQAEDEEHGDICFRVDAKAQEVTLTLTSHEGFSELKMPYLPLLQLMDQLQASGFTAWQLPEITDEDIALLFQEAE
jgi:hypothetical protein